MEVKEFLKKIQKNTGYKRLCDSLSNRKIMKFEESIRQIVNSPSGNRFYSDKQRAINNKFEKFDNVGNVFNFIVYCHPFIQTQSILRSKISFFSK